ncbi:hypothetical protein UlMin_044524 [Ulmus minor]
MGKTRREEEEEEEDDDDDEEEEQEEEAQRLKLLAEAKYRDSNLKAALKYAKRAQRLFPNLEGVSAMVSSFKLLRTASKSTTKTLDWYKILDVEPFSHFNTIKKQYKKLAFLLHPDKNPHVGSEDAFKLVNEAFRFLSDKGKRKEFDLRLKVRIQEEKMKEREEVAEEETFWTACSTCRLLHQFERRYLGQNLVCPSCGKSFEAMEVEGNGEDIGNARVRVRGERIWGSNSKKKVGSEKKREGIGDGKWKNEELRKKGEEGSGDSDGEVHEGGGRLRRGGLRRRMSSVEELMERSKLKRAKTVEEETMTLAQLQSEIKQKAQQEKSRTKLKESDKIEKQKKDKIKEKERHVDLQEELASKKSKDVEQVKTLARKKSGRSALERCRALKDENLDIMPVEDSDFYDFDKDRVERSFKKGQVWAVYDDDDGMPRNYALIDEVVSVNPFEVKISWLDLQGNGDEGLLPSDRIELQLSCGRFKVSRDTSFYSVNIFSHVVDCERAAREAYRIYPKKGSVWALYNEAALASNGRRNLSGRYDIVVVLTSFSEIHGLSMAYLEKVDGFKTIFKRREIGSHAIRWLEKEEVRLFSHQIPARKLSGSEAPELVKDCWELDPASLSADLLGK